LGRGALRDIGFKLRKAPFLMRRETSGRGVKTRKKTSTAPICTSPLIAVRLSSCPAARLCTALLRRTRAAKGFPGITSLSSVAASLRAALASLADPAREPSPLLRLLATRLLAPAAARPAPSSRPPSTGPITDSPADTRTDPTFVAVSAFLSRPLTPPRATLWDAPDVSEPATSALTPLEAFVTPTPTPTRGPSSSAAASTTASMPPPLWVAACAPYTSANAVQRALAAHGFANVTSTTTTTDESVADSTDIPPTLRRVLGGPTARGCSSGGVGSCISGTTEPLLAPPPGGSFLALFADPAADAARAFGAAPLSGSPTRGGDAAVRAAPGGGGVSRIGDRSGRAHGHGESVGSARALGPHCAPLLLLAR